MIKRWAKRFLRWFCHPDYYAEIAGDLEELYQRNLEQGKHHAQWKYLLQVISLLRPSLMRSFSQNHLTHPAMFKSYFKISTRILLRHKFYSFINILGLAVGMGVCLLIYQYIYFELSYDRFHSKAQNTYRLILTESRNGEVIGTGVVTTHALGVRGKENIPEIADFVRVHPNYGGAVVTNPENNGPFNENEMLFVDGNFFQIFDFPLKLGDREAALDEKYNIVITEQMAMKYFGDANPIGKVLKVVGNWGASGDYTVSGVLKTLPVNSHLQFDFLLPMEALLEEDAQYKESDGWTWGNFVTYVTLDDAANLESVGEKFDQVVTTYQGERLARSNLAWSIGLQPLLDIHLRSDYPEDPASNNGSIQNVQVFAMIAIFILFMAWVNYINLSTARAMYRAKEVGVRKAVGAFRKQLIGQFMIESFLINCIAAMLAIGIALLILPVLNNIIGKEIPFNVLQYQKFWFWFVTIIIAGSILSGLYPAFILSSFKPISVLKSVRVIPKGGLSLRKGLIVFQFLTSVLLISGTYLVYQQIIFMKNHDLGVDMEKILVVNGPRVGLNPENLESRIQTFKNKAVSHHSISSVSSTGSVPGKLYNERNEVRKMGEPADANQTVNIVGVDAAFSKTYDLHILAGRFFTEADRKNPGIIINEEAVKVFGLGSIEDALGEKLTGDGENGAEIIGVVKNVHWTSLKDTYSPVIFLRNKWGHYFSFKINLKSNVQQTVAHIESVYKSVFPGNPFYYFFLEEDFNRQYQADLQFRNLFSAFSILAIFIACLGLFALVSFSATLRVKEIGIRKVFGAGVGNLMLLLSREYLILLCIAVALAVPVILLGGKAWLENYAYKVGIGIDLFLIPGLILIVISFLTVSYRTYASASANPVESLRTE